MKKDANNQALVTDQPGKLLPFKVFVLPTQEDIAAFRQGTKPQNILERTFEDQAQYEAYQLGIDAIGDEEEEIDGLNVVGCKVTFTRETEEDQDADVVEFDFTTTAEAEACRQGIEDAEGLRAPLIVEPDDDGYEQLEQYSEATKVVSKPMTYCDANAILVLAAGKLGLSPLLVDKAIQLLSGGPIHPMIGAAISQEACRMNDLVRHDAALLAKGNNYAEELKRQYGFA